MVVGGSWTSTTAQSPAAADAHIGDDGICRAVEQRACQRRAHVGSIFWTRFELGVFGEIVIARSRTWEACVVEALNPEDVMARRSRHGHPAGLLRRPAERDFSNNRIPKQPPGWCRS